LALGSVFVVSSFVLVVVVVVAVVEVVELLAICCTSSSFGATISTPFSFNALTRSAVFALAFIPCFLHKAFKIM